MNVDRHSNGDINIEIDTDLIYRCFSKSGGEPITRGKTDSD